MRDELLEFVNAALFRYDSDQAFGVREFHAALVEFLDKE